MNVGQINPHIRYARSHNNIPIRNKVSYCYDCRLFYIVNGKGFIRLGEEKYAFSNNTAIYLPGGCCYELSIDESASAVSLLIFNFDLVNDYAHLQQSLGTADPDTFSENQVLRYPMPTEFAAPMIQTAPSLCESLQKCTDEFLVQSAYYRETASAIFKVCLLELLRQHTAASVSAVAVQIMNYVHEHYHEPELTNQVIAQAFNYHPHHASQLMRQATGKTLHHYLLHYRIRVAKNYLITTDLDIGTIAWKSGFNSVSHFIKMFRIHTGVTPRNYRQSHANLTF